MSRDSKAEHEKRINVGGEILKIVEKEIKSPSDAMILLQEITIYLWNQYQIDWQGTPDFPVAEDRKQRFLDFVGALVDNTAVEEGENQNPAS